MFIAAALGAVLSIATLQQREPVQRPDTAAAELDAVVISATRSEQRLEDTPLRVEVIDEEEIAEKAAMTPGDIAMLLTETSGLRVQPTNPALGAASVRVQGMRGRYTLILADGLPLYGSPGGFGLVQIPPLDLTRVEIIKGASSALYGSAALGGVVNLVSRRPGPARDGSAMVNATSRGGADAIGFLSGPISTTTGYTLLAGFHRQSMHDADGDGWADIAGYDRVTVRPRFFFSDGAGRSAFATIGILSEDRRGGALRTGPPAVPGAGEDLFTALSSRRIDGGFAARWLLHGAEGSILRTLSGSLASVRGSANSLVHHHDFGDVLERDRHQSAFVEATLAIPRGRSSFVIGAAWEMERFRARDVSGFDFSRSVPAAFAQADIAISPVLTASASGRVDAHDFGIAASPRVSLLLRPVRGGELTGLTLRLSGGSGTAAPTPLIDEIEATGLRSVLPPGTATSPLLRAERAHTFSADLGIPIPTPIGIVELNVTAFRSEMRRAILARPLGVTDQRSVEMLLLDNARLPARVDGVDAFARTRVDDILGGEIGILVSYVRMRATEEDPATRSRRATPLTPRQTASLDLIWESEGHGRIGFELFHTGRQPLADNPYQATGEPYTLIGLLAEWGVGPRLRVFVNGENLTGVRQSRFHPVLLPARGAGGRWTTDMWTEAAGATINAGVRLVGTSAH